MKSTFDFFFCFQGVKFNLVTINSGKDSDIKQIDGKMDEFTAEGIYPDILREMKSILNFTYSLKPISDGQFGTKLENGSWTGIMGAVSSGKADFGDFTK